MKTLAAILCSVLLLTVMGCAQDGAGAGADARGSPSEQAKQRSFLPGGAAPVPHAVCYGPHRDGQRPGGPDPSAEQLREDVRLMAPHWKLMRIYGATGPAATLLQVLREEGAPMHVMLGVWVAPDDPAGNAREAAAAVRLAAEYADIVAAVCVGNETQIDWSAHRCPPDTLLAVVRRVRAAVDQPVTVADDFNFWNKPESRDVAGAIDFITMHAHPMWNGRQLEDALPWLQEQLAAVRALHPDRLVLVGETGWATTVHVEGEQAKLIKGRPGEAEQRAFHQAVRAWAAREGETVFFFEAFDENWKGGDHPDEVEKHWGLFGADRKPKAALADRG